MPKLILTVQYQGNKKIKKWRLGISTNDSRKYFGERGYKLKLKLPDIKIFSTITKCGCIDFSNDCRKSKKGYDLYEIEIHNWIKEHHKNTKIGIPNKLLFNWSIKTRKLVFISKYLKFQSEL